MPKVKETTALAALPIPEVPDWVTKTPKETEYNLTMYENGDCSIAEQDIYLTRAEFIALKAHLAKMRGLVPASQQPDAA